MSTSAENKNDKTAQKRKKSVKLEPVDPKNTTSYWKQQLDAFYEERKKNKQMLFSVINAGNVVSMDLTKLNLANRSIFVRINISVEKGIIEGRLIGFGHDNKPTGPQQVSDMFEDFKKRVEKFDAEKSPGKSQNSGTLKAARD